MHSYPTRDMSINILNRAVSDFCTDKPLQHIQLKNDAMILHSCEGGGGREGEL